MKVGLSGGHNRSSLEVLVVDDDPVIRELMTGYLREQGQRVNTATNRAEALEILTERPPDLVFLDLHLPDSEGTETLSRVKERWPEVSIAVITAFGGIKRAVDAMRCGADDVLPKPLSLANVAEVLDRAAIRKRPRPAEGSGPAGHHGGAHRLLSRDPLMQRVVKLADQIAPLPSTVLIEGESGTGKELIARRIHRHSAGAGGPFVAFNCAAIPEQLLESELFGYEKGAFTGAIDRKIGYFEMASGGTIFIDEISEMSIELQAKLLRVIQERTLRRVGGTEEIALDARIIASTNRRLEGEIAAERFRKDLYYRINVLKVVVPPLRDRPGDIILLSEYFLDRFARISGKPITAIDDDAREQLLNRRWEGNVRELQNAIERAVVIATGKEITADDLLDELLPGGRIAPPSEELQPFAAAKREFEQGYLIRALERARGNVALAARLTGISRQHLYDKLARYRLEQTNFRTRRGGAA